jgi:hypothetical protein
VIKGRKTKKNEEWGVITQTLVRGYSRKKRKRATLVLMKNIFKQKIKNEIFLLKQFESAESAR